MPLILLCWAMTSEAEDGGTAVEVELYHVSPLHFVTDVDGSTGAV